MSHLKREKKKQIIIPLYTYGLFSKLKGLPVSEVNSPSKYDEKFLLRNYLKGVGSVYCIENVTKTYITMYCLSTILKEQYEFEN